MTNKEERIPGILESSADEEERTPGILESSTNKKQRIPGILESFTNEEQQIPGILESFTNEEQRIPGILESSADEEEPLPLQVILGSSAETAIHPHRRKVNKWKRNHKKDKKYKRDGRTGILRLDSNPQTDPDMAVLLENKDDNPSNVVEESHQSFTDIVDAHPLNECQHGPSFKKGKRGQRRKQKQSKQPFTDIVDAHPMKGPHRPRFFTNIADAHPLNCPYRPSLEKSKGVQRRKKKQSKGKDPNHAVATFRSPWEQFLVERVEEDIEPLDPNYELACKNDMAEAIMNPPIESSEPHFWQEILVHPASSSKSFVSEICCVCLRMVPDLEAHANARHLPWFVSDTSACGACMMQFNKEEHFIKHIAKDHPGINLAKLKLPHWVRNPCMREYFTMLANALDTDISRITEVVSCFRQPVPSEHDEQALSEEQPSGSEVTSLKDCSQWKTVLQLIAASGGHVGNCLVKSSNPVEGYMFVSSPDSSKDIESQKGHLINDQQDCAQEKSKSEFVGSSEFNSGNSKTSVETFRKGTSHTATECTFGGESSMDVADKTDRNSHLYMQKETSNEAITPDYIVDAHPLKGQHKPSFKQIKAFQKQMKKWSKRKGPTEVEPLDPNYELACKNYMAEVIMNPPVKSSKPFLGQEIIVHPTSSSESFVPEVCCVCLRTVPDLEAHANARHLPWFVSDASACGVCMMQFNKEEHFIKHIAKKHPRIKNVARLKLPHWVRNPCMKEYFTMLANALGTDISKITEVVSRFRQPVPSEHDEQALSEEQPSGSEVTSLKDCSHWTTVLQLIAASGGHVGNYLVKSSNPVEGYMFVSSPDHADSSKDIESQKSNLINDEQDCAQGNSKSKFVGSSPFNNFSSKTSVETFSKRTLPQGPIPYTATECSFEGESSMDIADETDRNSRPHMLKETSTEAIIPDYSSKKHKRPRIDLKSSSTFDQPEKLDTPSPSIFYQPQKPDVTYSSIFDQPYSNMFDQASSSICPQALDHGAHVERPHDWNVSPEIVPDFTTNKNSFEYPSRFGVRRHAHDKLPPNRAQMLSETLYNQNPQSSCEPENPSKLPNFTDDFTEDDDLIPGYVSFGSVSFGEHVQDYN